MEIPWGDFEAVKQLYVPEWSSLNLSDRVHLVIDMDVWGEHSSLGRCIPSEQVIRISGQIPLEAKGFPRVSVVHAKVTSVGSVIDLCLDSRSTMFYHAPVEYLDLLHSVEVCSGMACSSIGLREAGFVPKVAVEKQPKLAMLHDHIHGDVKTILGSVTDPDIWVAVWDACPGAGTLTSGFACQPYSRGGSMGGSMDSRADVLPGVLRLAHILQVKILILECVVPARTNGYVRQHLRALREQLGFHIHDATYRLEDVWASCRFRWWVVATHPCLGPIELPPMPVSACMTVRSLIPFVREWPFADLQQLILTEEEKRIFTLQGNTAFASLPCSLTRSCQQHCTPGEDKQNHVRVNVGHKGYPKDSFSPKGFMHSFFQ